MKLSLRRISAVIAKAQLLLWLSFGLCINAFALTAPGTILYNAAQLTYDDAQINLQIRSNSNTVSVSVGRQYLFAVDNTHQLNVEAGFVARFPHRIRNIGNTDDSYRFAFAGMDRDSFSTPQVILDINGNGAIDPNEPLIDSTPIVETEEALDVIVLARVSSTLPDGVKKEFNFSVESDAKKQSIAIINTVKVGRSGELTITLSSSPECSVRMFPGETISHVVSASKSGFREVQKAQYQLDGEIVEGLIYELPISENVQFVAFQDSGSATLPGTKVLKLDGLADNEWITASSVPETSSASARITHAGYLVAPGVLGIGATASFTVDTQVIDKFLDVGKVTRTAYIDADSNGLADVKSNFTCSTFTSLEAALPGAIVFVEPVSSLRDSGQAPDLFTDTDFTEALQFPLKRNESDSYTAFRDGIYLELLIENANHPKIQTNSAGQRHVVTTLSSELTGDSVQVIMLQTNTAGVFRSVAPITLSAYGRSDGGVCPAMEAGKPISPVYEETNPNCVLESRDNDRLLGLLGDGDSGIVVSSVAMVKRQSLIFDTHSRHPVAGALVQIMLADERLQNDQLAIDSISGAEFEFVTDFDGRFSLPRLAENTRYYLNVIPPLGYRFPSKVLPFSLDDFSIFGFAYGRNGIIQGDANSGIFTGAEINARRSLDIPLDLSDVGALLAVDKVAVQTVVDIGQSVSYLVTVQNSSDEDLEQVVVDDIVPFGFRYVDGTTRLANEPSADPVRAESGGLAFEVGTIAANESVVLSYSLRATAGALDGNGVNTAVATGFTSARQVTKSLPGRAKVRIQRSGVLSNKAALFGKVYVDQNCDGIQNNKEWPIGGVRLYLQDGTYAITDGDGQYSVYGLEPGLYVVKVDEYTVPEGLDLKLLTVEQAADPSSSFVNLTEGDWHKVDFAASCPKQNVQKLFDELKERNSSFDSGWYLQQAETFNTLDEQLTDNPQSRMSTADGDVSNGLLDGPQKDGVEGNSSSVQDRDDLANSVGATDAITEDSVVKLDAKEVVTTITSDQAKNGTWLWPTNGISLNGRFMAVVRAGVEPTLYVNGAAIPASNLGERILNRREKAQVVAWYGVELDAGENTVEIKGADSFGNQRVLASGVFKRPSSGTRIKLRSESSSIAADGGRTKLPVSIEILDDNGYRALGVYYITLESNDGSWAEPDIQDTEPGRQIRIENGFRTVHYLPSDTTGEVSLAARTGEFSDELTIFQVPEVRPLIVSGYVEAGAFSST
ncbi:MAG: SdrD B-like domain-containing protein, partial [Granulosicoccus sp.]